MADSELRYYPKMERAVRELRQEIAEGKHGRPGEPFMTTRYLMTYRSISLKTAHKVLGRLCADGLLEVKGKRYYLTRTPSLSASGTKLIGLLLTRLDTAYFSNLASNLEEIARELGAELAISVSGYDREVEKARLEEFVRRGVAGIAATPWAVAENEPVFAELPVPYVLIGRTLPHLKSDAVLVDNLKAAREVARHLLDRGCDTFFYVGPRDLADDQRLNGFRIGLLEAGVPLPTENIFRAETDDVNLDPAGLRETLARAAKKGRKSGVFCYHDLYAARVVALCHEEKIAISDSAAVAGFDNLPVASAIWPQLTSVAYPVRDIARMALEILFTRMARQRCGGGTPRYLEPRLIVRASTGIQEISKP